MGDVIEMKRLIAAQVKRFGYTFKVEYRAGRTRELSDKEAAFYVDEKLEAWLQVGFHLDSWNEIYMQVVDDFHFITTRMLGLPPESNKDDDFRFLEEAEMYVLNLLSNDVADQLVKHGKEALLEEGEDDEEPPSDMLMTPMERGRRVVEVWHNHGMDANLLPQLVAIEIYDALDVLGFALSETIDETDDLEPGQYGEMIRHLVATLLEEWHSGEGEEVIEDDGQTQ